jgi:formylglycine-generating enzyme required for sulfatase activity
MQNFTALDGSDGSILETSIWIRQVRDLYILLVKADYIQNIILSGINGIKDLPVVHISHTDATEYCAWAGND